MLLLNAVRDVANALSNLIDTTRAASGKSVNDPAMEKLKTSAKVSNISYRHFEHWLMIRTWLLESALY